MDAPADAPALPLNAVVYATDFSSSSENPGRYASLLARRFCVDLLVTHAFTLSYPATEVEAEDGAVTKSEQRLDLESELAALAARLGNGCRLATPVLLEGDAREAIPRLVEQNAPCLAVMGTHARGRMETGLIGSVAERILRATSEPSLTVGPEVPVLEIDANPTAAPFRRILYATDLSPAAARGARYAAAFSRAFGAPLDVLHVVQPEEVADRVRFSEIQKRFRATLDEMAPQHADTICRPRGLVEIGSAHQRILEEVRKLEIDLLVLSIHKSSHLWLKSRTSGAFHIIAHAPCPVLTITG